MWQAAKYAIPFNVFVGLYILILYGEVNSWRVVPVGGLVLLFIDVLYFRQQDLTHPKKPNISLYTVAAMFLTGALAGPVAALRDHMPLLAIVAFVVPGFVGACSLRLALRIQRLPAPTKTAPGIQLSQDDDGPIIRS